MQSAPTSTTRKCYLPNNPRLQPTRRVPGLARELARMNLSLNYYTQWYWKIDLHNLLHFLSLRAHEHAQHEIRAYADVLIDQVVRPWVPITHAAFCDYRLNSRLLSEKSLQLIRALVAGRQTEVDSLRDESGLSRREWIDFMEILGFDG